MARVFLANLYHDIVDNNIDAYRHSSEFQILIFTLSSAGLWIIHIFIYIFIHHEGRNIKTTQKGEEKL